MTETAQRQTEQNKKQGDPLDKIDDAAKSLGAVTRKEQEQTEQSNSNKTKE